MAASAEGTRPTGGFGVKNELGVGADRVRLDHLERGTEEVRIHAGQFPETNVYLLNRSGPMRTGLTIDLVYQARN